MTPASASVRASWASTPGRDFRLTVSWVVLGIPAYFDDVEATRNHETAWRMLATLAERALDLGRESLR
jgi:molecular chaperone DnaK (HSP70)